MITSRTLFVSALLAAGLGIARAESGHGTFLVDSTGGSAQARGELVTTPAGIVPAATDRTVQADAATSGRGMPQPYADSTGGSAQASAQRGFATARDGSLGVVASRATLTPTRD